MQKQNVKIQSIRNGIVIDHITAGRAINVLRILGVDQNFPDTITLAMNVPSNVMGKKDIVKVENRDLDKKEIDQIAIIAPDATINRISQSKVISKEKVVLPDVIVGVVSCPNPKCVTNDPKEKIKSTFTVRSKKPLVLRCRYCERDVS
ncbi:MAG: aspartate carbamoyltransferase regulatory subunit [Candidatus Altiarchaeales archaeon IMC4]|nr:MAG: aspartate carbamoyltransferase regulatory subunit [Candidatus Altiarchaeales archaeon IMC4]